MLIFMNGIPDPYNPYHFLKECNENLQVCVCVCVCARARVHHFTTRVCLKYFVNDRFLAEVSTKLEK